MVHTAYRLSDDREVVIYSFGNVEIKNMITGTYTLLNSKELYELYKILKEKYEST